MVSILFLPEEAPWNYRYSTGFSHSSLDGTLYLFPRRDSRVVPWTGCSRGSQDGTLHLFPRRDSRIVPRTGLSDCSQGGTLTWSQLRFYEEGITGISGTKEGTSFSLWSLAQGRSPKLIACVSFCHNLEYD